MAQRCWPFIPFRICVENHNYWKVDTNRGGHRREWPRAIAKNSPISGPPIAVALVFVSVPTVSIVPSRGNVSCYRPVWGPRPAACSFSTVSRPLAWQVVSIPSHPDIRTQLLLMYSIVYSYDRIPHLNTARGGYFQFVYNQIECFSFPHHMALMRIQLTFDFVLYCGVLDSAIKEKINGLLLGTRYSY